MIKWNFFSSSSFGYQYSTLKQYNNKIRDILVVNNSCYFIITQYSVCMNTYKFCSWLFFISDILLHIFKYLWRYRLIVVVTRMYTNRHVSVKSWRVTCVPINYLSLWCQEWFDSPSINSLLLPVKCIWSSERSYERNLQ